MEILSAMDLKHFYSPEAFFPANNQCIFIQLKIITSLSNIFALTYLWSKLHWLGFKCPFCVIANQNARSHNFQHSENSTMPFVHFFFQNSILLRAHIKMWYTERYLLNYNYCDTYIQCLILLFKTSFHWQQLFPASSSMMWKSFKHR